MALTAEQLLESAIEAYSKPLPTVTAGGVSTAAVGKEIKRADTSRDALGAGVDEARRLIEQSFADAKGAVTSGANADVALGNEKQRKAEEEANINKRANEIAGIGMAETDQYVKWSRLATEATNKAIELDQVIAANSVNFLDDPLGWVQSKFQEPQLINQYNAQVNIANSATAAAAAKKVEADNLSSRMVSALPKITLAEQQAANEKILAEAAFRKAQLGTEFAKNDVDFLHKKYAADLSMLQAQIAKTNIDQDNAKMAFQAQMKRIELAQTEAARLEHAGKLRTMLDDQRAEELTVKNYNAVTGANLSVAQLKRMEKSQQDNVWAVSTGSWGAGPAYALQNATSLPIGQLPEQTRKSFDYLMNVQRDVENNPAVMQQLGKAKAGERTSIINNAMTAKIRADIEEASSNKDSRFHEIPLKEMLDKGIVFKQDNPLTAVLRKQIETSKTPIESKEIAASLLDLYAGNTNIAAGELNRYYSANIALRNSAGQYTTIGVPPDLLKGYKVRLNLGFGFGGTQEFDLTDPVGAQNYVVALDKMKKRENSTLSRAAQGVRDLVTLPAAGIREAMKGE